MDKSNRISIFILLLLLLTPSLLMVFPMRITSYEAYENRETINLPTQKDLNKSPLKAYRSFFKYYDDNFGFRKNLIFLYNALHLFFLEQSPNSLTKIGAPGWLFYKYSEYSSKQSDVTDEQVERFLNLIEENQNYLGAKGIVYALFIAPYKGTVYPNKLYRSSHRIKKTLPSLRERVIEKAKKRGLRIFDPQKEFNSYRKNEIYFRADHHWNDIGAYLGYKSIIEFLNEIGFKDLEPMTIDMDSLIWKKGGIGHIGKSIGWQQVSDVPIVTSHIQSCLDDDSKNELLKIKPDNLLRQFYGGEGFVKHAWSTFKKTNCNSSQSKPLKLGFIGDSFSAHLIPYLAISFDEVKREEHLWLKERSREEYPHIVIEQIWEHYLTKRLK